MNKIQEDSIDNFNFLKSISVPEKISVMHNFVEILLKNSKLDQIEEKSHQKDKLYQIVETTVRIEEGFLIAKFEYEQKENRFAKLTGYSNTKLDYIYSQNHLMFKDVDSKSLKKAVELKRFSILEKALRETQDIIKQATNICYNRMELLTTEWNKISEELLEKINNFEQRGLKKVSNNLRLKLIPELNEMKSSLKQKLVKKAENRDEINTKILEMVEKARDDIFGDLTESQIELYERISITMSHHQILDILEDEKVRLDLFELLETKKVELKIEKLVDQLI